MKSVFISGSIGIKKLNSLVVDSLKNIINNNLQVIIGDANGIDFAVQKYFANANFNNVTVYSISNPPRNIASPNFSIKIVNYKKSNEYLFLSQKEKAKIEFSERKKQTFKDIEMSKIADYYLIIWNKKSEGSRNNILRGISYNKKIKLIIEKEVIPNEKLNINYINKIFETEKGIGIMELKRRLNIVLGENNLPSKDLLKKNKRLRHIYPTSNKTFLHDTDAYDNYKIFSTYKGKKIIKYKPSIIKEIKKEFICFKNDSEENLLLKHADK